ncbi:uncharacterized protein DUF5060 [Litorimonas taeanensis]|uniref:Uncharacterized protein DUF5060 n=1 Tax=Litorimonas taeanensis TaxID=568099 RepID=A0A420WDI2_9PROT|nr:DUF5060 domain-containing protein [Litorimonas taeanensis]RKQ69038.1 uncharacterized protein DUF5060 [Litorimonas taeanensis]
MRVWGLTIFVLCLAACTARSPELPVQITGEPEVWHVQTLSFEGPMVKEERSTFTDYSLDVFFYHDSEDIWYYVTGYFAGSKNALATNTHYGNIWEAKFVPPISGTWHYQLAFTHQSQIAFGDGVNVWAPSGDAEQKFYSGYFDVSKSAKTSTKQISKGFLKDWRKGYLEFSGTNEPWLKTGAGSPENIFAYADFDGTYDAGGTNFPSLGKNQLHEFEPHIKDWREGDPTWGDGKGKGLIGLMNYYADVGVNNQYMVMMNYKGDGQDVFPYVDPTDPYVFDVSKLAQWQLVFDYMDKKGIAKNFLFLETENESYFEVVDGVEVGKDFADSRKLYYREMVARFGHSLGLVWNLGEEHGVVGNSGEDPYRQPTSVEQRRQFAQYIRDLDPYDHAIVSHNWPDGEEDHYGPLLGEQAFSGISLQAHHSYFEKAKEWTERSKEADRPWVFFVDEPLGWEFGAQPDADVETHKRAIEGVLWPALMGGASGVDWYFGWQNNAPTSDLSNEDQRTRHALWVASAKVRKFWEETFDLLSLQVTKSGDDIIMTGLDKSGQPIRLTAERKVPVIPEGEGHNPWEYELISLTLEQGGETRRLDPFNPQ